MRPGTLYNSRQCNSLQESADNAGPDMGPPGKDALLEEACKKYEAATQLCPTLHEVHYLGLHLPCLYFTVWPFSIVGLQMHISTLPVSYILEQYYHQDICISALFTGQKAPTTGIMLVAEDNYLLFRLIITGR